MTKGYTEMHRKSEQSIQSNKALPYDPQLARRDLQLNRYFILIDAYLIQ